MEARRLIFIGYALPRADFETRPANAGSVCLPILGIYILLSEETEPLKSWMNPTNRFHLFLELQALQGFLFFFLALAHLVWTAFLASAFLSSGVKAAIRAFPPFLPPAFPPFFPISRITSEIRSRFMHLS